MGRTELFCKNTQLFEARRAVALPIRIEELSVLRATVKRDLGYLCERTHVPIVCSKAGSRFRNDRYVLMFPYSNETELLMDIRRHGPEIEVPAAVQRAPPESDRRVNAQRRCRRLPILIDHAANTSPVSSR
jgi:hypothetical protein